MYVNWPRVGCALFVVVFWSIVAFSVISILF